MKTTKNKEKWACGCQLNAHTIKENRRDDWGYWTDEMIDPLAEFDHLCVVNSKGECIEEHRDARGRVVHTDFVLKLRSPVDDIYDAWTCKKCGMAFFTIVKLPHRKTKYQEREEQDSGVIGVGRYRIRIPTARQITEDNRYYDEEDGWDDDY